jgi:O-antigen ligase
MNKFPWLDKYIFNFLLITLFIMPFSITLNEIFMGLTISLWVLRLIVCKEKIKTPPLGWLFLIFLFVSLLSAIASDYTHQALSGVWDITRYTVTFFIIISTVKSNEQTQKVIWTLIASTALWAMVGMIHQFFIFKRVFFDLVQFFALGNKNAVGQYLQMMLSLIVGLFISKAFDPRGKKIFVPVFVICLLGLFLSSAKTMWVAFILTLFVFAVLKRSRKIFIGVGCILLALMLATLVSDRVRVLNINILKSISAPSMHERYIGWKASYPMFRDNPILGVGPKCFMEVREKYKIPSFFGQGHNMIFHVAFEMGILGVLSLIAWIVFYFYFIATYRKRVKNPIYLGLWFGGVGYIVILAIGGITEPTIGGEHSQLFMTLVGLMHVGLKNSGKDNENVNSKGDLV